MELCIDTSTRYASVGISEEGRIVAELAWRSERNHSVELAPALRRVMEHAGVRMEDLTAVFAALGPGGFSALRVGLSVAKSLAMARNLPLVGVNTLDIEAVPFYGLGGSLATVIGAGRSKVYLGTYDGSVSHEGDYRVVERERLEETLCEGTIVCGEGGRSRAKPRGHGDIRHRNASADPDRVSAGQTGIRAAARGRDGRPGRAAADLHAQRAVREGETSKGTKEEMSRTLVLLKPDSVQRALVGDIIARLERRGLKIAGMKLMQVSNELAHRHYGEHEGKPFFADLVEFITSGPIVAMVLEGENAVQLVRATMGSTNPADSPPGSIRGDYGMTIGMNLVHGSDSDESAEREIGLFFSPDEVLNYERGIDSWVIES